MTLPKRRDGAVVTLLIADDHDVVRLGLRRLLEAEANFRVVGEAKDGLEVLPAVERLRPDVVVLSMHANEAYVVDAFRHGAGAYVLKGSDGALLVDAIRAVLAGKRYLS